MAGFALFKRYKSQFLKMLNVVSENFLVDLKSRNISELTKTITEIQTYIEDKKFLQEPEGKSLQSNLLSNVYVNYWRLKFFTLIENRLGKLAIVFI